MARMNRWIDQRPLRHRGVVGANAAGAGRDGDGRFRSILSEIVAAVGGGVIAASVAGMVGPGLLASGAGAGALYTVMKMVASTSPRQG